jgi:hypothetical protein
MPDTEHEPSGGAAPIDRDVSPGQHTSEALAGEASQPPDYEDDVSDLIDTAEHLAGDPVVAWSAIKTEVERRIAHGEKRAASGTKGPTGRSVEHDRPREKKGGAMPINPGAPAQARREFVGFDLEVATYARLKPELISRVPGKFVVIVGTEVEGPVNTFGESLRAGYRRFGLGPLFIKQILTIEPVVEVSRDIVPCRS